MMLDKFQTDPFEELKKKGPIREDLNQLRSMNKHELVAYVEERLKRLRKIKVNWLSILVNDCLRFKNPCLINVNEFDDYPSQEELDRDKEFLKNFVAGASRLGELPKPHRKKQEEEPDINKQWAELQNDGNTLWVGICISKPGKHSYVVRYTDANQPLKINE